MNVRTGIDVLQQQAFAPLMGKRVGLLTNPTGVNRQLESTADVLWRAPNIQLTTIFTPEHGLAGSLADGVAVDSMRDVHTNLPVLSLYGETLRPTPEMTRDLDVIVCDIQDIGVRYYTFAWTVSYILEAAADQGFEVVILDRPNPLGGAQIHGPTLDPAFASFVGRFPVPVQHGLTLGELMRMVNDVWLPEPASLTVIACENWQRTQTFDENGLTLVSPSPNMPTLQTIHHYPGACLIEGTNLSEGRGTTLPFEVVGAPWINGYNLADRLNESGWEGVRFRPHSFRPTASKHSGQECHGVQVHILDMASWKPVIVWLNVIHTLRHTYEEEFTWLEPGHGSMLYHFDRLIGSDRYRKLINSSTEIDWPGLSAAWERECAQFEQERQPYLLY